MYTNSYQTDQDFSVLPRKMKYGNIIIGDNVWIGTNVYIGCGVNIGNNSVIGANSVVVKDVEKNGIYSGSPAKLIRHKK
jgi:maltose O-acetyltransferase